GMTDADCPRRQLASCREDACGERAYGFCRRNFDERTRRHGSHYGRCVRRCQPSRPCDVFRFGRGSLLPAADDWLQLDSLRRGILSGCESAECSSAEWPRGYPSSPSPSSDAKRLVWRLSMFWIDGRRL